MKSFFIRALLQIELEGCCTVPVCNAKARAIAQHLLADPWNSFVLLKAQQVDWIHFLIGYLTFRSTFFFFPFLCYDSVSRNTKAATCNNLQCCPYHTISLKTTKKKTTKKPSVPPKKNDSTGCQILS